MMYHKLPISQTSKSGAPIPREEWPGTDRGGDAEGIEADRH